MSTTMESELQKRWIWVDSWCDADSESAGRLVAFKREFHVSSEVESATLCLTADTRYKLWVNGSQAAIGPTRGSDKLWYYDTVDIAADLRPGLNEITIEVLRFFPGNRTAYPFARTSLPGLTVFGSVKTAKEPLCDVSTGTEGWTAEIKPVVFPFGLKEDVFLHIFERPDPSPRKPVGVRSLNLNTGTGEMTPWNLQARLTPLPEIEPVTLSRTLEAKGVDITTCDQFLAGSSLSLTPGTYHMILEASAHTTAFLQLRYQPSQGSHVNITYAECFENEPKSYPWLRDKGDRTGPGILLGPHDTISLEAGSVYNPFWYRTFRFLVVDIHVGQDGLKLDSLSVSQTNYPFHPSAVFESSDSEMNVIWDVSLRTLRNCMFDGYSDCPYYEQLQYAEDTRSSGLFHYLLSGDDRLMRQAITGFAVSTMPDGLVQARYPSHIPQIIPGFSLFWVLQICDHYLHFSDDRFTKRFIHQLGMVIDFFRDHIDERGLVATLPVQYWQFVDWTDHWKGSPDHPNGGVPSAGRKTNTHTFASMLFVYTLQAIVRMARDLEMYTLATEYDRLSKSVLDSINRYCYDGRFYLDSTCDQAVGPRSQHAQVFAVLIGATSGQTATRIIHEAFTSNDFVKCSYVFAHYAFRAMSKANLYETLWSGAWDPWRKMLAANLTTWEEDTVTQRSDCHAWGSVAIYEYTVEVLGLHVMAPGWTEILFAPRVFLLSVVNGKVALGADNIAKVEWKWKENECEIKLELEQPARIWTEEQSGKRVDMGSVRNLTYCISK